MADAIDNALSTTDGIFKALKPFITALHGYTHGGLEQLGRRFDPEGNVRATYTDGERFEVVNATTAYLVMFAVAWCQIYAGGDPAPSHGLGRSCSATATRTEHRPLPREAVRNYRTLRQFF